MINMHKVWLKFPFTMNAELKLLGARFDPEEKRWYVKNPMSYELLRQYVVSDAYPWETRDWRYWKFEDNAQARAEGCKFDPEAVCWYKPG
jgi:hypothetical protein